MQHKEDLITYHMHCVVFFQENITQPDHEQYNYCRSLELVLKTNKHRAIHRETRSTFKYSTFNISQGVPLIITEHRINHTGIKSGNIHSR